MPEQLLERAREAIHKWDIACATLLGEFDAGDELAEVLGLIISEEETNA